jgi:nickel-dependent lactate racemase
MRLYWGDETLDLKLDSGKTVSQLPAANETWKARCFSEALEFPFNFPPLDQCATPDDRVVVALDPGTLALEFSFPILLERLQKAGIAPAQVTILLPSQTSDTCLAKILTEASGCCVERHNPSDPMARMILGGTRDGRQIYLNRRLVEADLTIVVSCVRLGGGNQSPASLIYPGMASELVSGIGHAWFVWPLRTSQIGRRMRHIQRRLYHWSRQLPYYMQTLQPPCWPW